MTLEEIFEIGNNWINDKSKDKLFAVIGEKTSSRVICNTEKTTIEEFLEVGNKNGVTIFLISKSIFDKDEVTEEIEISELENSKKKRVETQLKKLKKFENKIDFLCFSYVLDGLIYEYGLVADWFVEIEEIKTKIEEITEDDEVRELRTKKEKSLPKKRIKEISETLAKNEDFFKRRNDYEKLGLFLIDALEEHNLEESDMGWYDKTEIISKAKSFFERKLLKQKEVELVKQIAELKEKGTSKIAIRSKLDLTEGMLNKYYYK